MKFFQMTHWTAGIKFRLIFVGQWRHFKLFVNTGAECTRAAATCTLYSEPFSKWHPIFRFNIDFNSFPLLWFAKISRTEKNGWRVKTLVESPTTYPIFNLFAVIFILTLLRCSQSVQSILGYSIFIAHPNAYKLHTQSVEVRLGLSLMYEYP